MKTDALLKAASVVTDVNVVIIIIGGLIILHCFNTGSSDWTIVHLYIYM